MTSRKMREAACIRGLVTGPWMGKKARAMRAAQRSARKHRYQWGLRKALAASRKERFGLDIEGAPHEVADARRLLRNARKLERRS